MAGSTTPSSQPAPKPGVPPLQACLAVSRTGHLSVDPTQAGPVLEQPPAASSRLRTLVLNRPAALNALDKGMIEAIAARVAALEQASTVDAIVLTSVPGRAFCAGGDIRSLYDAGVGGDPRPLVDYFRAEYSMDYMLGSLRNTRLITVLNGIVMGGGVGLSLHGKFRVATEKTMWAMPENAIGLFPDCASSHFLSRQSGGMGMYLSLTGARLKSDDSALVDTGIATHYVPSQNVPAMLERLSAVDLSSGSSISRAISDYASAESLPPMPHADVINECFGKEPASVEEIIKRLEAVTKRGGDSGKFADGALNQMLTACPVSVKVSFEAMRRAKSMTLAEVFEMDFRLGVRMASRPDFYNGVKSAIVTKDKSPVWSPSDLASVRDDDVQALFEPFSPESNISDLGLVGDGGTETTAKL